VGAVVTKYPDPRAVCEEQWKTMQVYKFPGTLDLVTWARHDSPAEANKCLTASLLTNTPALVNPYSHIYWDQYEDLHTFAKDIPLMEKAEAGKK